MVKQLKTAIEWTLENKILIRRASCMLLSIYCDFLHFQVRDKGPQEKNQDQRDINSLNFKLPLTLIRQQAAATNQSKTKHWRTGISSSALACLGHLAYSKCFQLYESGILFCLCF